MPPKRKSDALDLPPAEGLTESVKENDKLVVPVKKPRKSDASVDASGSKSKDEGKLEKPKTWQDVKLVGEDEGPVPVYDDCAEVRRKIGLLQKTAGWKVTHWLKEIGGINNNSFGRFMKEKGRTDGASNGTYYAAYVYFEKVRILEGKKRTAKRISNESTMPDGYPLENRRRGWVLGPA
ncbi:hypothetical protein Hypma_015372 [Hypsizygus marmoreus]|uniref:DUF7726 domain-containing protein n=1 Tax=Hypsizygus marmoreus TaxID=39966 RepID=A0A369K4I3_HYPMA|nr:hypothetical protein Hypma_015372 [Hypsizygus marmoreus]